MPTYRVCKTFTVESGHMLSRHAERCRFPHGHTRTIEVIVEGDRLNSDGMLIDFKALRLAVQDDVNRYDHAMAVNSTDPLVPAMKALYPEALVIFDNAEPTTEAIAEELYGRIRAILERGWREPGPEGRYAIPAGQVRLSRVRVWETPSSWAEFEG